MTSTFVLCVLTGFAAQLVDGALGMAYGVTASTMLLALGVPPASASATVHASECFTTGASALSHSAFGNVSRVLFRKLLVPGVLGAVAGACVLSSLPGERLRPVVAAYLAGMGAVLIVRAVRSQPARSVTTHLAPLAFVGALVDAIGGGGWGPIVATTLIGRGNHVRQTVGSVAAVEFFVTMAASATFVLQLGLTNWPMILGLAVGGTLAAPVGAVVCRRVPVRPLMIAVGVLVIALSARTFVKAFDPPGLAPPARSAHQPAALPEGAAPPEAP
jgi:uncharacterized membrane protein YfcA